MRSSLRNLVFAGLLLALGGMAAGTLAIGGITFGFGAFGGIATGKIAMGSIAQGTVAIGDEAYGEYALQLKNIGPDVKAEVSALIRSALPKLPDWIIDWLSSIAAFMK